MMVNTKSFCASPCCVIYYTAMIYPKEYTGKKDESEAGEVKSGRYNLEGTTWKVQWLWNT